MQVQEASPQISPRPKDGQPLKNNLKPRRRSGQQSVSSDVPTSPTTPSTPAPSESALTPGTPAHSKSTPTPSSTPNNIELDGTPAEAPAETGAVQVPPAGPEMEESQADQAQEVTE